MAAVLAPVDKTMLPSRSGRRECWSAVTKDKEWAFAREEDGTTSWTVRHLPTKTVVMDFLGSLRQCRAYVGSGEAREDLERMKGDASG